MGCRLVVVVIPEPVDLDAALAVAVENLDTTIKESRAELHCGRLGHALGNARDTAQVLQNIVGNSLKFRSSDVPPIVRISSEIRDGLVTVSVCDNGRGIPVDKFDRAFQMFDRLDGDPYPGTGIGLAVCRKIVERSGNRIWLESHDGPGLTVRFTLAAVPG